MDSKLKGKLDKLIEKLKASPAADKELNASHLRNSISSHNVNLGVLAAFMTALAAAIYVSPPSEPKCFGEIAIGIQLVLEWIAMGCFFITIITTVVICSDLQGVPNHLLLLHLQRPSVSTVYDLPALTTWIGLFFMELILMKELVVSFVICILDIGLLRCLRFQLYHFCYF